MQKRIVLDSNILISAFLKNGQVRKDLFAILSRDIFEFYYSEELLEEYKNTINKKKFHGKIDKENANIFLDSFEIIATKITVNEKVSVCRDKNDDFLLSLYKTCKAHYLITGDNDLLTTKNFYYTIIISTTDFCKVNETDCSQLQLPIK